MQNIEGQNIFLSIGHKDPVFNFEIQEMIHYMGLEIKELLKGFNKYEGAQIIGGRSQFLHLVTMNKSISLVGPSFEELIYTGQTLKTVRVFECVSCLTRYKVGAQQEVKTIEKLKETSCDKCGNDKFKLIKRNKINHDS
jgi:predicted methyltransferase